MSFKFRFLVFLQLSIFRCFFKLRILNALYISIVKHPSNVDVDISLKTRFKHILKHFILNCPLTFEFKMSFTFGCSVVLYFSFTIIHFPMFKRQLHLYFETFFETRLFKILCNIIL